MLNRITTDEKRRNFTVKWKLDQNRRKRILQNVKPNKHILTFKVFHKNRLKNCEYRSRKVETDEENSDFE